jgi:hypothetical protein
MVGFMIKWALAAIPAAAIFIVLFIVVSGMLRRMISAVPLLKFSAWSDAEDTKTHLIEPMA